MTYSSIYDAEVEHRSDLIGRIVWQIVSNDLPKLGRSIYLLIGLDHHHLAGVSRMCPNVTDETLRLAISPHISPNLFSKLPNEHLSEDTPVFLRNSAVENIVVIAVPDSERDSVGSSLGEVVRIDRTRLQSEVKFWVQEIETGISNNISLGNRTRKWLHSMIQGLNNSGVTKELDQFAEFVYQFISFPSGTLLTERLNQLGWVLNLPCGVFDSIPLEKYEVVGKSLEFEKMFGDADTKYTGIPFLRSSDDKRLNEEEILDRVRNFREPDNQDSYETPPVDVLDSVEKLVKDQNRLRRGDWLPCQEELCRLLDWSKHGEMIFGRRRTKKPRSLIQRTLDYFEKEHPGEESAIDRLKEFDDPSFSHNDNEQKNVL